jgi:large subunit ribosomal protein L19
MEFTTVNKEARKTLDIRPGDTVRVMQKIEEKGKTRLQPFEGMVLARKHGTEPGATFTVRRVSNGFGVEKIFPLYSPMIDSIEITKRSKVRRSKLYYIRETALKQISKRMKMMFVDIKEDTTEPEPEVSADEVVEEAPVENTEAPATEGESTETPKEEVKEEESEEKVVEEEKTEEAK